MEDYVTFEQAQRLKELGFDWKCFSYYLYSNEVSLGETPKEYNYIVGNDHISAPTLALVQKWLRETKETEVIVIRLDDNVYSYTIYGGIVNVTTERTFDTYEKALSKGIDRTLELLK